MPDSPFHLANTPSEDIRISFVIPVLNEERLVMRLVELFTPERRKKYRFEVIASDGASNDASLSLLREAQKRGLVDTILEHTETRRQTIAEGRNKGAEAARGRVLVFINADTVPHNMDTLCEAVTAWEQAKTGIAAATPVYIAPEEQIWSDRIFHACMNVYVRALNVLGIGMGRGECQIVRRAAFEELGGYKSNIVAGEDFDLYTRLRRNGSISWLREAIIYESPRRFRKYGYLAIIWRWFSNSIAVLVLKKSVAREWELIRE
ncbi:MAG: glycosyltransferase [Candidatus Kapaibacterium sp.]|nr:MAG: glycosyltransferase [Candidatus Kapabacteria bacterium]